MVWIEALNQHQSLIESFIMAWENVCTGISSRLVNQQGRIVIPQPDKGRIFLEISDTPSLRIHSLYYVERGGFSFIILKECSRSPDSIAKMQRLLLPRVRSSFSCMGRRGDCEAFIYILGIVPRHHFNYLMMKRLPEAAGIGLNFDLNIHHGSDRNAAKLFPLQIAYEQEETVIPGHTINPRVSFQNLKRSLLKERLLFLEHKGQVVAKAQTNARGVAFEQIGGIYTIPEMRNRGFGSQLVEYLSREIIQSGKCVNLFVKNHNRPAISLYKKCGFVVDCPLSIMYIFH